jgi:molybdopterin converting factor subunit 1
MAAPPVQLLDVLLFASAAEAFGAPQVRVAVPAGATAADVREALLDEARRRTGRALPASCRLAVNQRFAPPELPVSPGGEVALIPPVAGG